MIFTEDNIPHLRFPVAIPESTAYNVTTESIALAAIGVGIGIAASAIGAGVAISTYESSQPKPK